METAMRARLVAYRNAAPSPAVWRRIEAQISPQPAPPARLSSTAATVLSAILVFGVALTGLGAELLEAANATWAPTGDRTHNRLTPIELAVAERAAAPGPWDAIMPPPKERPASDWREAYNRVHWIQVRESGGAAEVPATFQPPADIQVQ